MGKGQSWGFNRQVALPAESLALLTLLQTLLLESTGNRPCDVAGTHC